jgi:murein DD-endopeptidase MepM/ murein hydrolase activator NlpD
MAGIVDHLAAAVRAARRGAGGRLRRPSLSRFIRVTKGPSVRHLLASLAVLTACAQAPISPDNSELSTTTESLSNAWAPPLAGANWKIGFNIVNGGAPGFGSCFGKPLAQLVHAGEDWGTGAGTPVRAIGAGTVVYAAFANYPGSVVVIRHNLSAGERTAMGIATSTIYSQYGHLASLLVGVGSQVSVGQQIASVLDQAGNSHLHWEVRTEEVPQLCGFNHPGPGYTNSGTNARSWGYLSPQGSVTALTGAGPGTCDNNVPVNGTACNPADPGAQFVCTSPGLPSAQQWTRQACGGGQTCVGTRCQGGAPACGSGLFCAGNAIPGASACTSGSQTLFCCPSGQTIVNGACASATPPPCGSGLFCALNAIPGASRCLSGTTPVFCCAPGRTIVNGACSP